ncbi:MAG: recombination mediator RecR [Deltaproteobacteria bacterium]|jgi:recombination protein RecR|nr:recombination mediator RecR [Deltaproteobacteria bacterium]
MKQYQFPLSMRQLIAEFSKLPAIGEKSATRLAYHVINGQKEEAQRLATAILAAKEKVCVCEVCFGLAEEKVCPICSDLNRDRQTICVVEKPADLIAIERSGGFNGLYHVLHGLWSPLRGIGPEETKISELLKRIRQSFENVDLKLALPKVEELIIATSTTVEGDATALYIAKNVAQFGIKVSRIAQGLPKGGELEYSDQGTITHALNGRSRINS